jgi:glutathione reductase (NADPH)
VSRPDAYDLVAIGTGAGGAGPAARCRAAGWRVAIVDDEPYGGTCALRGCDPKRVLVGVAELADWHRRMRGSGIAGDSRIDWSALMRFKRTFTEPVAARTETRFQKLGIDTYHGTARFTAEDRLVVGNQEIEARHTVIASGATPIRLGIPGAEHVRTSTDFLELDELPTHIAFIGAGFIAFEFAHVALRAGAAVTMLGRSSALRAFDQDLVQRLVGHTQALGADLRLNTPVTAVEAVGRAYRVHAEGPNGDQTVDADLVVHAAGREPNTRALDLGTANVKTDARGGVEVNEYLQSVSNPQVYAAGDATLPPGKLSLTPVAGHEGVVVASNLLKGNHSKPDYRDVPRVVFSVPALASVGLTAAEAQRGGLGVKVKSAETGGWFANRRLLEPTAMLKTVVDESTGHVLGAHLLGPGAEHDINIFALAMRHGITAADLSHMIYAYPTSTSDLAYVF